MHFSVRILEWTIGLQGQKNGPGRSRTQVKPHIHLITMTWTTHFTWLDAVQMRAKKYQGTHI